MRSYVVVTIIAYRSLGTDHLVGRLYSININKPLMDSFPRAIIKSKPDLFACVLIIRTMKLSTTILILLQAAFITAFGPALLADGVIGLVKDV